MSVKLLLYCTKAKPFLVYDYYDKVCCKSITADKIESYHLNGKIVAECECEKINYYEMEYYPKHFVMNDISIYDKKRSELWGYECFERILNEDSQELFVDLPLFKDSCLTFNELGKYVCPKGGFNNFYALHLSNVKVLNNPLKFEKDFIYKDYKSNGLITKAPQNMCNVYDRFGNHYILISIQPQHLAKILNGEKTIEVRKKILNSLKEAL